MNVKIKIRLSGKWLLEHTGDDVSPIEVLGDFLQGVLGDRFSVDERSFNEIVLVVNSSAISQEVLESSVKEEFKTRYGNEGAEALSFDFSKAEDKTDARAEESNSTTGEGYSIEPLGKIATSEEKTDETEGAKAIADIIALFHEEQEDDKAEESKECKEEAEAKAETDPAKECMDDICALVGVVEFKELAKELYSVAPILAENKTYDTVHQAYLFSINDGHGYTTYLENLATLIDALKIRRMAKSFKVVEEKLNFASEQAMMSLNKTLSNGSPSSCKILSIDICECMNKLNAPEFRAFIMRLPSLMDRFIFTFKVPFVDKEVLSKIHNALSDILFVRTMSFPPLTNEEIKQFAQSEIQKYGFRMSKNAWAGIEKRVVEEKRDGRFYGLNTVKKIVRELLYKKQLDNAKRGKNDLLISKKDTYAICDDDSVELSGYEMLDRMVGASGLRDKINEIISQIELSRMDAKVQAPCIHMRFLGSPGTGKTTVARIIGKILKEKGVLRVGNFFEYAGRDFCGRFVGETAPKTAGICRDAYGSVLFIDEAYSLYKGNESSADYGREALDTLIAEMENHRSDMVVIMAGYTDEMNTLMEGNAGLASRMPYVIEFPNFTREQLYEIYVSMIEGRFKYDSDLLPAVKEYFLNLSDSIINAKDFSNARFVRNLFERTWAKSAMRCQLANQKTIFVTKADFERASCEKEFSGMMEKKKSKIGF
ncbi:MAG: AAA family ATPase [Clostridia bacterium]|nr:AAA family ATPase [Clostridia bacterium]